MVSYKELYEKVGSVIGWDFSRIDKRTKIIGKKWDFLEIVKNYVSNKIILLDIGTGGGKQLLDVAKFVKKAYGTDNSKSMIAAANRNLIKSKIPNVKFKLADAKKLPFSEEYFDVVMCRHAPFYAEEVFRVLKPDGVFITQQVGEEDKENIKEVFGRGQSFGEKPGSFMNKCIQELKNAGFKILRTDI